MITIQELNLFLKETRAKLTLEYDPDYSRWIVGLMPGCAGRWVYGYGEGPDILTAIDGAVTMQRKDADARRRYTTAD